MLNLPPRGPCGLRPTDVYTSRSIETASDEPDDQRRERVEALAHVHRLAESVHGDLTTAADHSPTRRTSSATAASSSPSMRRPRAPCTTIVDAVSAATAGAAATTSRLRRDRSV